MFVDHDGEGCPLAAPFDAIEVDPMSIGSKMEWVLLAWETAGAMLMIPKCSKTAAGLLFVRERKTM